MKKAIQHILSARKKQITKEQTILQSLPHQDFRFANPFIVLHHLLPEEIQPNSQLRIQPHPHRGFAPVTFQLQGEGYHKDNAGHEETVKAGDVQWMFAGKGLLHSEGPTKHILDKGGTQELLQLWVNVPKAHKWDEPAYQSATKEQLPKVLEQDGINLRLASGEYDGETGPLKSYTPVISIVGEIKKGNRTQFTATPSYWTLLYVVKGSINVNMETVDQYNLVVFEKENDEIIVYAKEDAQILFLSAEPINEPVAARDNFVMNSQEEAEQAIADYKNGVFGTLNY